jgi:hypothetical protein
MKSKATGKDNRLNQMHGKTLGSVNILASVRDFLGPAPGAIKKHLNTAELSRITLTALTAGAGTMALLQAILTNVGNIFPAPTDAALAAVVLTLILETLRRLGHGQERAPAVGAGMRHPGGNGDGGSAYCDR